jgi:hypothetical protein
MLDTLIYGNYTLKDLLTYGGGLAAVLFVLSLIRKIFKKEESSKHTQLVRCTSCGWRGQVSIYVGLCPRCSNPLGEQRAKN